MQFFKWLGTKLCDFGSWVWSGPQQSHPSLFQLRAFWAMVLQPIGLAIVIAFFIAQGLHYPDVLLTKEGFDNAYEYFKIPLWIAALSLPFAGFYASHHRSVQAAAQITATESKNAFENNIKHREVFKAFLDKEEARWGITFHDGEKLYENIFSQNDYRRFEYYADDMKRDVFYNSCVDDFGKVANNSCFIIPVVDELTLYLRWFRENRFHPHETYKSLELLFEVIEEFRLLVGVKGSELVPWKRDTEARGKDSLINFHSSVIHPYMNQMFNFLGNSFVEIIKFSYSTEFLEDQQYLDQFLEFQHELSEAQEVLVETLY